MGNKSLNRSNETLSTMRERVLYKNSNIQQIVLAVVLLLMGVVLSILSDRFLSSRNITNVLIQATTVMITGSGVTLLMISGNIDLSVGSVMAITGVMYATFAAAGIPLPLAIILAVLLGGFVGLINGFCVTKLNITPVIATMGTMYAARGGAFILCGGAPVSNGLPSNFSVMGRGYVGSIPYLVIISAVIVALFIFIQRKTVIGKYAYAIGGNKVAAKLSGVSSSKVILQLYIIVGLLAGVSGTLMASRLGAGDPNLGTGFEFDVIIAVVLGGTSLEGGEGSIFGMVIASLIIVFLGNFLNLMNVYTFYQSVLKGAVLIVAVVLMGLIQKRLNKA